LSAFNQDITEEEQLSGFDAAEQGDESFLLSKLDEYPGVMPDLEVIDSAVIPAEPGKPSLIDDYEEIPEVVEEIEPPKEEQEFGDFGDDSDEEFGDFSNLEEEPEPISQPEPVQENFEDPELTALLESELERSKDYKSNQSDGFSESIYADDEIEPVPEFFQPVDENADEIQLSDIELDKPSTIDVKKLDDIPAPIIEEQQIEEEKPKIKKKESIFSVRRVLIYSSIIALLLTSLVVIYYDEIVEKNSLNLSFLENNSETDSLDVVEEEVVEEIVKERKPIELPLLGDTKKSSSMDTTLFDIEMSENLNEIEVVENVNKVDKSESISKEDYFKSTKKPLTKKASTKKNNSNKNNTKKTEYTNNKNTKLKKSDITKSSSRSGQFTVQIVSTPSLEDANDWLSKLKSRGINDGHISEKLVRDKIYYRVRFGSFESYDMASTALNKAGFDGSWVDRIK
jgi:cell division septation protein DedD